MSQGFLTIAYGNESYLRMALGLARSIRLRNRSCHLAIVTDYEAPRLHDFFDVVIPVDLSLGCGVSQKLHVDQYTPFEKTIFIDSDCLVFGNADSLWYLYRESVGFGVKGRYIAHNDTHYAVSDLRSYLDYLGLSRMALCNTGIFFFDRSDRTAGVFDTARNIYKASQCDSIGLLPYKESKVADEPILGAAIELHRVPLLVDDGGKTMTLGCFGTECMKHVNVLRGKSDYYFQGKNVEPLVIHFNAGAHRSYIYYRELRRLQMGIFLGMTPLPALIAHLEPVVKYYSRRIPERLRINGLMGLIPERIYNRDHRKQQDS